MKFFNQMNQFSHRKSNYFDTFNYLYSINSSNREQRIYITQIWYYDSQSVGICLQSPQILGQSATTPRILTLSLPLFIAKEEVSQVLSHFQTIIFMVAQGIHSGWCLQRRLQIYTVKYDRLCNAQIVRQLDVLGILKLGIKIRQ